QIHYPPTFLCTAAMRAGYFIRHSRVVLEAGADRPLAVDAAIVQAQRGQPEVPRPDVELQGAAGGGRPPPLPYGSSSLPSGSMMGQVITALRPGWLSRWSRLPPRLWTREVSMREPKPVPSVLPLCPLPWSATTRRRCSCCCSSRMVTGPGAPP